MAQRTREQKQERVRVIRANLARTQYPDASARIEAAGGFLRQKPGGGYVVGVEGRWEIHVYPGMQRFYRGRADAPRLVMPEGRTWSLVDVAEAFEKCGKGGGNGNR